MTDLMKLKDWHKKRLNISIIWLLFEFQRLYVVVDLSELVYKHEVCKTKIKAYLEDLRKVTQWFLEYF